MHPKKHYNDVIMGTIVSQITSLTSVYSTVYTDADQRKHQSSASLAFVWRIHRGPVNSRHKWPVRRKCFHLMSQHDMLFVWFRCVFILFDFTDIAPSYSTGTIAPVPLSASTPLVLKQPSNIWVNGSYSSCNNNNMSQTIQTTTNL